jgi:hypothetical protein
LLIIINPHAYTQLQNESDEGRFKIGDLVVGMPLQVMDAAQGYERALNERVLAAPPDQAQVEQFPLDPAKLRTYRGRLVDAGGKPVAGA